MAWTPTTALELRLRRRAWPDVRLHSIQLVLSGMTGRWHPYVRPACRARERRIKFLAGCVEPRCARTLTCRLRTVAVCEELWRGESRMYSVRTKVYIH